VHDVVDVHVALQRHYGESAAEFSKRFENKVEKATPPPRKAPSKPAVKQTGH
jgi:hypothetical protein